MDREFRKQRITEFLKENGTVIPSKIDVKEKIKLCSSDDFNKVAEDFIDKFQGAKAPTMISHVGGFYVMASLTGIAKEISNGSGFPKLVFFDRKINNIENGLFNTLLMKLCDSKERYLTTLFGLNDNEIIEVLNPTLFNSFVEMVVGETTDLSKLKKKEKQELVENKYRENKAFIDKEIKERFLTKTVIDNELKGNFNLPKIVNFCKKRKYNAHTHYELLTSIVDDNLSDEMSALFGILANNITDYLASNQNYADLIKYLPTDIKLNGTYHILANDEIYEGYRSLVNKNGSGYIKFVGDIDISKTEGNDKLNSILAVNGLIKEVPSATTFPIDIAFIPHIHLSTPSYPFIKKNVQDYIMLDKEGKKGKNKFVMNSTATLNIRSYKSIGALNIKEERDKRQPLTNLATYETRKGFPKLAFIAGANYGNIYHSEVDTQNMVDMAIHDKVDTVYIQGLFYATYFHHQTARRLLSDPAYETLDSRLKAAHKLVKRLTDAGIKVVYQMGDEEIHLYQDMFDVYTKEQGVQGNDFLKREDLKTKFDWVRPIIIQELIPYLIRSGEDIVNFYTDEEKETRVSEVCHALKLYKEGLPLGNLAKYINPKYLEDTDMFRVVFSTVDTYKEDDPALSVKLMSNPNFSHITQYGKPAMGAVKNLRYFQTGASKKYTLAKMPQLFVDSRQGFMSLSYQGEQATLHVPQMVNDAYYIENDELLAGIKERVLEDPTHKRVTQVQNRPNYPGGWIITGDIREKETVIPYYGRMREVMDYVQKTGVGLPELSVLHVNDTQIGSLTERLKYQVKMMDMFFYEYKNPRGIWGNGDYAQGWNYSKFANECRHLGSMSVTNQMMDYVKLQRPWIENAFGIIKPRIVEDKETSSKIIAHLSNNGLIETEKGMYENCNVIKKDIDYRTVDLKLPRELKAYESEIRKKLVDTKLLWFYHLVEGNHEYNTDWDYKGYNLIKLISQELETYKKFSGSDIEVLLTEYFLNKNGDIVNAPYGSKTINGYNIVYGHSFKAPGKGNSTTPTMAMASYFDQMGDMSYHVDRAFMGHLHIFETSVINNTLYSVTGSSAGQSGYEQNLGYSSCPLYVVDNYFADGRVAIDTIGTEYLDDYKIKEPSVKEMGLDNFIMECLTEYVPTYGPDEPEEPQEVYQRQLKLGGPNKRIGPKI